MRISRSPIWMVPRGSSRKVRYQPPAFSVQERTKTRPFTTTTQIPIKRCTDRAPARTPRILLSSMASSTDRENRRVIGQRLHVKQRPTRLRPPVVRSRTGRDDLGRGAGRRADGPLDRAGPLSVRAFPEVVMGDDEEVAITRTGHDVLLQVVAVVLAVEQGVAVPAADRALVDAVVRRTLGAALVPREVDLPGRRGLAHLERG